MLENFSQIPKDFDAVFLKKKVKDCVYEFGVVLAIVGALVGLYLLLFTDSFLKPLVWIAVGLYCYYLGRKKPQLLFPAWRGWMMFGLVLNKVMSPVVLFVLWIVVVTPTAIFLKLIGKKILDYSFRDEKLTTYYIDRLPKENDFNLLKRQF
jgi:predicted membrane protein